MNKILVLSNDKLFLKGSIFSNYNDTLNIIDAISKKFQIYLFSRNVNLKQTHSIKE